MVQFIIDLYRDFVHSAGIARELKELRENAKEQEAEIIKLKEVLDPIKDTEERDGVLWNTKNPNDPNQPYCFDCAYDKVTPRKIPVFKEGSGWRCRVCGGTYNIVPPTDEEVLGQGPGW